MAKLFPEKPSDSAKTTPPDFNLKVSEILNFIRNLTVEIPSDVFQNIPDEERIISFTEEDIKKIEKKLKPTLVKIFLKKINSRPQDIEEYIKRNISQFNIQPKIWKECLIKQPPLFVIPPETINQNIERAAELLGISKEDYIKAALKQPNLFCRSPETVFVKFNLYNKFINESQEGILNFLLKYPPYFNYSPERIMAFYVLSKLAGRPLSFDILTKNPDSFAKKNLTSDIYENIFKPLYDYFSQLFEERRKRKRKDSNAEKEAEVTLRHANEIIKYFGPKEQKTLTQEQLQRIKKLAEKIRNKQTAQR